MLASVIAASIVIRLGLIEALLRFYYLAGEDRGEVVRTGFAALFWTTTAGAAGRARVRRADLGGAARPLRRRARPDRGPRPLDADPVGVRADPAAGRRARPRLLRAHGRSTCWRRSRSPSTSSWSQDEGADGILLGTLRDRGRVPRLAALAASAGGCRSLSDVGAAAADDPLRPADDAGRAHALLAQLHRPDPDRPARRASPRRASTRSRSSSPRGSTCSRAASSSPSRRSPTRSPTTTRRAAPTR